VRTACDLPRFLQNNRQRQPCRQSSHCFLFSSRYSSCNHLFLLFLSLTTSQKVHLRRCASSFVTTTYDKYASFLNIAPLKWLEDSTRALHLELFTVSSVCRLFTSPSSFQFHHFNNSGLCLLLEAKYTELLKTYKTQRSICFPRISHSFSYIVSGFLFFKSETFVKPKSIKA